MKNLTWCFGILILFMPLASEALLPGEGIVLDRNTGDYIITYADVSGQIMQSRFVPSTKIDPALRSRFENQQGLIRYRYAIKNGTRGKQPLIGLTFDPVSNIHSNAVVPGTSQEFIQTVRQLENDPVRLEQYVNGASEALERPNGWSCRVLPNGQTVRSGFRIPCSFDDLDEEKRNGLQVGDSLSGFGFYSTDLPGVGVGQLEGFGDMGPGFEDEGPSNEIVNQLVALQKNDFVPRNAAVPTIAVPDPFDAAVLLDRIRTHVATWPGKQLLDPAFATQLDRYLVFAADAYRGNQTKAGKENIETLRAMLKKEYKDLDLEDDENGNGQRGERNDGPKAGSQRILIDRLAARILEFDLKYVLKRTNKD